MKRKIPDALATEIENLIDAGKTFKERQAERQRVLDETRRTCDAIILGTDPLPPPPDDAA